MGRDSTGAIETKETKRIYLKQLIEWGVFIPGATATFPLKWTRRGEPAGEIGAEAHSPKDADPYLVLRYSINGENFRERIDIAYLPSNLGKGNIPFFICPETGKLCRILYRAYGSKRWKHREAYRRSGLRLYYDTQTCSKLDRYNTRFWNIEDRFKKDTRRAAYEYAGKPTKRFTRLQELREEMRLMDHYRWTLGAPKKLRGMLF